MPCPNLAYTVAKEQGHGRQVVGSKDFKASRGSAERVGQQRAQTLCGMSVVRWVRLPLCSFGRPCSQPQGAKAATGACSGFTISAELIKPAKAAPAPLPQEALPAPRGPKKAKTAAPKASAPPAPAKRAASGGGSSAGIRLVGDKHAGWSTVGQPKGAGAAARIFGNKGPPGGGGGGVPGAARTAPTGGGGGLTFPPGAPRPVELQVGAGLRVWMPLLCCGARCSSRLPCGRWAAAPGPPAQHLALPLPHCCRCARTGWTAASASTTAAPARTARWVPMCCDWLVIAACGAAGMRRWHCVRCI